MLLDRKMDNKTVATDRELVVQDEFQLNLCVCVCAAALVENKKAGKKAGKWVFVSIQNWYLTLLIRLYKDHRSNHQEWTSTNTDFDSPANLLSHLNNLKHKTPTPHGAIENLSWSFPFQLLPISSACGLLVHKKKQWIWVSKGKSAKSGYWCKKNVVSWITDTLLAQPLRSEGWLGN